MPRYLVSLVFLALAGTARGQDMPLSQILIEGEGWRKVEKPGPRPAGPVPNPHTTLSADRGTLFIAAPGFLWAAPADRSGSVAASSAPYAPIRQKGGEPAVVVTGLATDRDGRIYAATDLGVQVFDPTGRLCGVLTPAAPGRCDFMAFEGDRLTLWIGNTKYARALNTAGAK